MRTLILPHDNHLPSTRLLLTKFLLTVFHSNNNRNDSRSILRCAALSWPNQPRSYLSLVRSPTRRLRCPHLCELSRGALDGTMSSLEFEYPARLFKWPDLAAQTPQHLHRSAARLSDCFALLDCRWKRLQFFTRLCAQPYFRHSFVDLEAPLLVIQSVVAAPVDRTAESRRVLTQHSRHQTFCSLQ